MEIIIIDWNKQPLTIKATLAFEMYGEKFAVHHSIGNANSQKYWTVSHVGTGAAAIDPRHYKTKAAAVAVAKERLEMYGEAKMRQAIERFYSQVVDKPAKQSAKRKPAAKGATKPSLIDYNAVAAAIENDEMTGFCTECGNEQADMGNNVACEECGFGPMPTSNKRDPGKKR